jgi:N-methylhydantoinase A
VGRPHVVFLKNMSSSVPRRVRVGIDVGGTFTDVVVVDHDTQTVISQLKVPTSHQASEGVARGIMEAIERALTDLGIHPDEVIFIAHSTTQATNALLEGDVAKVGVIGLAEGLGRFKARWDTHIPRMELAPNRFLETSYRFFQTSQLTLTQLTAQLAAFRQEGVQVVVVSEAFGVDFLENESLVAQKATAQGLMATTGHEVSSLYGLRTRTRTAVINGAILPKMIHTAQMTNACVKQAGIAAPLMIMRSDGGVMSVDEVQRRPIMTMLSGPAAGIAGALMHERVSDGIFIEVGGTSADISVIRDGQPQTKAARVGGHRTYLNTLDVRTLAIAGGSMVREARGKIVDVGARSAHIAGLGYACFQPAAIFDQARVVHLRPTPQDSGDYLAIETTTGERFALTPTCAANALGLVPVEAFAKSDTEAARRAIAPLAQKIGQSVEATARQILEISCQKVAQQIEALIQEYQLNRSTVELVGGGGGAASLVLFTGQMMGLSARLAHKAEVISTIGVALAMVRDTVERNVVDPSPADILAVRKEAAEAVMKIGAVPESIEVQVEVDTRRNLVRATAFGTTELKKNEGSSPKTLSLDACTQAAARAMQVDKSEVELLGQTEQLLVFGAEKIKKFWGGFFQKKQHPIRVLDTQGVVRLQRPHADVHPTDIGQALGKLDEVMQQLTDFGDAGRTLPDVHLLVGRRIVHLAGLADVQQALALAKTELDNLPTHLPVVIVAVAK